MASDTHPLAWLAVALILMLASWLYGRKPERVGKRVLVLPLLAVLAFGVALGTASGGSDAQKSPTRATAKLPTITPWPVAKKPDPWVIPVSKAGPPTPKLIPVARVFEETGLQRAKLHNWMVRFQSRHRQKELERKARHLRKQVWGRVRATNQVWKKMDKQPPVFDGGVLHTLDLGRLREVLRHQRVLNVRSWVKYYRQQTHYWQNRVQRPYTQFKSGELRTDNLGELRKLARKSRNFRDQAEAKALDIEDERRRQAAEAERRRQAAAGQGGSPSTSPSGSGGGSSNQGSTGGKKAPSCVPRPGHPCPDPAPPPAPTPTAEPWPIPSAGGTQAP